MPNAPSIGSATPVISFPAAIITVPVMHIKIKPIHMKEVIYAKR